MDASAGAVVPLFNQARQTRALLRSQRLCFDQQHVVEIQRVFIARFKRDE
jgi:hypothetical protein